MKILCIEDGSVDIDKLEQEGLKDGKILVYRQGSKPPYTLEFDNTEIKTQPVNMNVPPFKIDEIDNINENN